MRKTFLTSLISCAALLMGFTPVLSQTIDYKQLDIPSTIEVVVAADAGGSTDTLARIVMNYWQQELKSLTDKKVNPVIKNLPGAGTEIGASAIADANPDGSTIGILNLPHVPLVEASRDPSFEPWLEAYTPLGTNVVDPNVIILGENAPYDTLSEALQAAQDNPGSVIVGAQGPLSDDQLALYALQDVTGAKFAFIPFDGGAAANRALLGGEIDITVGNVFDYLQVEEDAKDAAIFSAKRYHMISEVPTLEESVGVDAGELSATRVFVGPAGLPEEITALYIEAFEKVFNNQEFQQEAEKRSVTLVDPIMGEEFLEVMKDQQEIVSRLYPYFEADEE